jgi:hypothetical protein
MTCRRLLFVGALQLKFRRSENCESVLIHRLLSGRNHKELPIYIYIYIYIHIYMYRQSNMHLEHSQSLSRTPRCHTQAT